mgnify:CR=1 FL=1
MSIITNVEKHNPWIVTLTIGDAPFTAWKPGQFVLFSVREGETWAPEHVYTISSAPEEGEVRITVKAAGPSSTTTSTCCLSRAMNGRNNCRLSPFA